MCHDRTICFDAVTQIACLRGQDYSEVDDCDQRAGSGHLKFCDGPRDKRQKLHLHWHKATTMPQFFYFVLLYVYRTTSASLATVFNHPCISAGSEITKLCTPSVDYCKIPQDVASLVGLRTSSCCRIRIQNVVEPGRREALCKGKLGPRQVPVKLLSLHVRAKCRHTQ